MWKYHVTFSFYKTCMRKWGITQLLKYIDGDFNDSSNKIYVLAIYFYNEFGWFKGSITFICDSWIYLEHKTGKMIKIFLLWGLQVSTNTYSLIIFDKLDKQVVNYGAGFYNFQIIIAVITIRAMLCMICRIIFRI